MSFHLHAEVKQNGVWEHFDCCNNDAFAATIRALVIDRGFPSDVTVLTLCDCDIFSHSHGWLSIDEITALIGSVPVNVPEGIEDVRFIFWFND